MAQSCAMTSKDYESSSPLLPFGIDRASRVDFSRQVADGLRASIKAGFFKPGDPVKLKLFIDGKANNYEYVLRVQDESGKNVFTQEKTRLTDEITLPGQDCGYYSMECSPLWPFLVCVFI